MNPIDDFDVSQLRWWRCVAVEPNTNQIQTFIVEIQTDDVYSEFNKIRQELKRRNLQFVEAKPITAEEKLAADKLARLKALRRERRRGLRGKHYSPVSPLRVALFVLLLILLVLWLVRLR